MAQHTHTIHKTCELSLNNPKPNPISLVILLPNNRMPNHRINLIKKPYTLLIFSGKHQ